MSLKDLGYKIYKQFGVHDVLWIQSVNDSLKTKFLSTEELSINLYTMAHQRQVAAYKGIRWQIEVRYASQSSIWSFNKMKKKIYDSSLYKPGFANNLERLWRGVNDINTQIVVDIAIYFQLLSESFQLNQSFTLF